MRPQEQLPGKKAAGSAQPSHSRPVEPAALLHEPTSPASVLALQGSVGNQVVNHLLGSAPASSPAPLTVQRTPSDKKGKGREREKSARQTAMEIDQDVKEVWPLAYGGGRQGNAPDSVRTRYARSMRDNPTSQTLSHQTFLVYDAVQGQRERGQSADVDEREVQGMLINNRLLFASNFNESMDVLRPFTGDGSRDRYRDIVSTHQSDAGRRGTLPGPDAREYVDRLNRADMKTQAVFAGQRGGPDDATAAALRNRFGKEVKVVDIDDSGKLHHLLTSKEHEGAIFFLRYPAEKKLLHAEQKLLLALDKSGIKPKEVKGAHAIMGRYRGCLCCTAALAYYRNELGFSTMDYDPNPGFYYWESLRNLYQHQSHVVSNPKFREYMLSLAAEMPSTPALSRMQPPDNAYENHGPETRDPASNAARRNYRTPSLSDIEAEYDAHGKQRFRSVPRERDLKTGGGSGGARVGKGSEKITSRLRAQRIITEPEDREQIQQTWLHGTPDERAVLFKYWQNDKGASGAELIELIMAVDPSKSFIAIQSSIYRSVRDRTGHESRDKKAPRKEIVRQPEKGKYAAKSKSKEPVRTTAASSAAAGPAPKKMSKKSSGWDELSEVIRTDAEFYDGWSRRDKISKPTYMEPSRMSSALAQAVADLRGRYTVASMAELLHVSPDKLRQYLLKHYGSAEAASPAARYEERPAEHRADVTMADYGSPAPAPSFGGMSASSVIGGYEERRAASYLAGHGSSGAGPSTGYTRPQISGYTLRTDSQGQWVYVDNRTGAHHFRDPQTGRRIPLDEPSEDVKMSGSHW